MIDTSLESKLNALRGRLEHLQPGLIAVSGGVDSRLLLHIARQWKLEFSAVHAVGPHQSLQEQRQNKALLQGYPIISDRLHFNPLTLTEVRSNSQERCYWCKKALFTIILDIADKRSLRHVLDGTQQDDLAAHRPGHRALRELAIQSPLAWVGLTKNDIRRAAKMFGLAAPDQPARACLLTRFPYNRPISTANLDAVGQIEDALSDLGLRRFRFRITGHTTNLLQLHPEEPLLHPPQWDRLQQAVANAGLGSFDISITTNLSGFFDTPVNSPVVP
ncbi:ATP-dependent sacrificial sulfur transferase LarE [Desulfonatronum thioautotrophicum]|uniref:ATP-dependent sacrificial sulfur transferase LarE n=1 Tax=Desulfonatronum thioautotrophicum TaxID=617001 RepID=UPI00069BB52D|nr:ATP-dependent sacrificial sulfur transferase LarE [Desulfonatronum thioautotrophicum]